MDRYAEVTRKTGETDIVVKLDLDGSGVCDISTGVLFFDHMLNAFGRHGLFDLRCTRWATWRSTRTIPSRTRALCWARRFARRWATRRALRALPTRRSPWTRRS